MQVHVDPLGGWSGDMFAAACLDAFPQFWPDVEAAVAGLGLGEGASCRLVPHTDGTLTGRRFLVAAEPDAEHAHAHMAHEHHAHQPIRSLRGGAGEGPRPAQRVGVASGVGDAESGIVTSEPPLGGRTDPGSSLRAIRNEEPHDHHEPVHQHRAWNVIRGQLTAGALEPRVADHAVGIFALLAEAEGVVHGIAVEEVTFHEVGAVDSIVDIVAAAVLIDRIGASRWTSAPLPLGGGRVKTAHGWLPVPAPATVFLLRGLDTIDDGVAGERVTPTGAAVARYLLRDAPATMPGPRRLAQSGTGFGTRTLPGLSNCLRVLAFDEAASQPAGTFTHRELGVIEFEVDDQSAEDLTHGLDHIRALDGVHDVLQSIAFGKKGRMATHVQVLVAPRQLEAAIAACLTETTTIGLRFHIVQGAALPRQAMEVEVEGRRLRVKTVTRPDGTVTGKTEAGDVAADAGHAGRIRLRRAGEAAALVAAGKDVP